MGKYIGRVDEQSNFYNFKPLGEIVSDGSITLFTDLDREKMIPESIKQNINLYYSPYDLEQVDMMESQFPVDGRLMVMEFVTDDLEANYDNRTGERNKTGYKVPARRYFDEKKLRPIGDYNLYYIIPRESVISDDFGRERVFISSNGRYAEGDKVLIAFEKGHFYGPFTMYERSDGDGYFIKTNLKLNKYTIPGVVSKDVRFFTVEEMSEQWGSSLDEWRIVLFTDETKTTIFDAIDDENLLREFETYASTQTVAENGKIDLNDVSMLLDGYKSSMLSGTFINEEICRKRTDRLKDIILSKGNSDRGLNEISDLIVSVLSQNKNNDEFFEMLLKTKPEFKNMFQNSRIIQDDIEKAREQLDTLRNEISKAEEEKEKKIQEIDSEIEKKRMEEETAKQLETKEKTLKEVLDKLSLADDIAELSKKNDEARKEQEFLLRHNAELSSEAKSLDLQFTEKINRYQDQMVDISFDGFMANKMLRAAAAWEEDENQKNYDEIVSKVNSVKTDMVNASETLEYLCRTINIVRPQYSRNTIINILICVTQSFLTVFSGQPGSGKTSICNIIANVLGLNTFNEKLGLRSANRYLSISVERGWTSKRDFIGYYNPLSKTFDKNNKLMYDALTLLDIEEQREIVNYPYLVLLDEANLSPMEYYWGDFVKICDDREENNTINLGENYTYKIPHSLRFVATINNDNTTEELSPRLIDRAWIISLPQNTGVKLGRCLTKDDISIVEWKTLEALFMPEKDDKLEISGEVKSIYDAIVAHLKQEHILVSPRAEIAIKSYWVVASKLMSKDNYDTDASIVAIDYAIAQKILPMVKGNGEEYGIWLENFRKLCESNNLMLCESTLSEIIARGESQMKYYQFFN